MLPSRRTTFPDPAPIVQALQHILETGSCWQAGGRDPVRGCDCYGLVHWGFSCIGIMLSSDIWEASRCFQVVKPPYRPWDVILSGFEPSPGERHVGLLMAPTWGFHCASNTNGLARFSLEHVLWRRSLRHGLRYKEFLACG